MEFMQILVTSLMNQSLWTKPKGIMITSLKEIKSKAQDGLIFIKMPLDLEQWQLLSNLHIIEKIM